MCSYRPPGSQTPGSERIHAPILQFGTKGPNPQPPFGLDMRPAESSPKFPIEGFESDPSESLLSYQHHSTHTNTLLEHSTR